MYKILPYSRARQNLASIMDEAVTSRAPIAITRRGAKPVVLISLEEYSAMDETAFLMRSPANRKHLLKGIKEANEGKLVAHDLIEVDAIVNSRRKARRRQR
jgi:antitoxin YefM